MDKLLILPNSHYDTEVFQTREEYLEVGYKVIFDVLDLLKSEPEYRFCLDQSSYIEPFLKAYPELAGTFRELVREGRLEIVGGMHVMSDLNMISGESIVRQFEWAKDFFRKELGTEVRTGWTIDTFGHCRQMPQILRGCGFESYFFGRVARAARSEFLWEGLDGTRIPTHWMVYHYIAFENPGWYGEFRSRALECHAKLKPYATTGFIAAPEGGDFNHPARQDPSFVRQWNADPARPFDLGLATPGEFMDAVLGSNPTLPVVSDDFNPVFQGCYSARIRVKQKNRSMEGLLYEAEAWNALAVSTGCTDRTRNLHDAWEPVLFNQGHDVLGGVQTDRVFEGVMKRYAHAESLAEGVRAESLDALVARIDTRGEGIPVVVFNALAWKRTDRGSVDVAYVDDDVFRLRVRDSRGAAVPAQTDVLERFPNGAIRQARVLFVAGVPALGHEVLRVEGLPEDVDAPPVTLRRQYGSEELNEAVLENEFYRARFDLWKGCMSSLVLKETGEELIDPSRPFGNLLVQEDDQGDFWEIGAPLRAGTGRPMDRILPLALDGPGVLLSSRKGGTIDVREREIDSEFTFVQNIAEYDFTTTYRLLAGIRRIEIESSLTNRTRNVRYRVAFPTTLPGGTITQSVPFGCMERPEGEFPALDWVDLSLPGKGLGILNCGLPGNSTVDGAMLLTLLKCTSFVSYAGDDGFELSNSSVVGHEVGVPHRFHYALVPHAGDWRAADLPRQGAELNHPLTVRKASLHDGELPPRWSFVSVDDPRVMVSALRRAGDGLLLRVFETTGQAAPGVQAVIGRPFAAVVECDLLGDAIESTSPLAKSADGASLAFDLKPFEIRTFRFGPETAAENFGKR